ncbi:hypothetical protein BU24DRAFT_457275 [Aaosphaeria arxii CBS 175.79]|uniref:Uncharacterized protein n=1 Tax=Aaosphaeria arxii CBS 175.79 TaxID=1450172 RepID=A0A6A5Y6U4_9PLEO|nr:uncharacterized protein BU24DRAFT_457275 [Aaosphaeria arxii CBS 175.79]KAF2021285.1 hypothetical protein BU24DRAFT_457275 [Aaosphaeria arxii CBS 175.79]
MQIKATCLVLMAALFTAQVIAYPTLPRLAARDEDSELSDADISDEFSLEESALEAAGKVEVWPPALTDRII